jgi:RNA polymerase sigma-70 factor (ECF subfamily)
LTGDAHAAEDLAQETLLLAWRQERELRDPDRRPRWLSGIARNLCLHWLRRRGLEASRSVQPDPHADTGAPDLDQKAPDEFDLEVELERRELVDLIDRALALLPPETRDLLVRRYVHESPHAEIAERLGVSEQAVWMRLNRGKLLLKRVLTTDLRQEAVSYGLTALDADGWQETRIWCSECGERRLLGRFAEGRDLWLDCVSCLGRPRVVHVRGWVGELVWGIKSTDLLEGVKGYKPALNRMMARSWEFYRHGIAGRTARCPPCRGEAPLRISPYEVSGHRDVQTHCPHCGRVEGIGTTSAVAGDTPEARAFWHEHGRIRTLPAREVEASGVPAILSTLESVANGARLEVVLARDTLEVIGVHGAPRG